MNENNRRVIERLRRSISSFRAGEHNVDQMHSSLELAMPLLENDGTRVSDLINAAEGDVEEIRFLQAGDEQRIAVESRMNELIAALDQLTA